MSTSTPVSSTTCSNIPTDLYTPIFAISRIAGWCAHLIEEIVSGGRIIRPAYKSVIGEGELHTAREAENGVRRGDCNVTERRAPGNGPEREKGRGISRGLFYL